VRSKSIYRRTKTGHKPLTKSEQMARVRTKSTEPEIVLRRAIWIRGFRYRLHPKIPGRPDFVFTRTRIAVFVDGCFWHGCPRHGTLPATNRQFWQLKMAGNVAPDRRVNAQLAAAGWQVVRIWEHQIEQNLDRTVRKVLKILERPSA